MENGTQPQPPSQPSSSLPGQSQPQPHIHHISQTQQTQQAHQQAQDHGHVEAQSSHQLQPRPRKFTIQSNFGNARQRRSRKNRPCDACRKRKTGCVITTGPPCSFCKSRGIVCQSTGPIDFVSPSSASDQNASGTDQHNGLESQGTAQDTSSASGSQPRNASVTSDETSHHFSSSAGTGSPPLAPAAAATVVHQGLVHTPMCMDDDILDKPLAFQVSSREAPVPGRYLYALEDAENRTAHFMGPAAEQDTYLLDDFRCVVLSERYNVDANIIQVYSGSDHPADHPVHFLLLQNGNPEYTMKTKKDASDAIESKVWPHGGDLIRLFFKHVHPMYPVVSKGRFLRRYKEAKEEIPASLRGAVYALASVFWDRDPSLQQPCPFQQHELIGKAHIALRWELENPNLFNLQACLLLLHAMPPVIDSAETPNTWIQTAEAVACAQMIGLHLDPTRWNIEPWEKKLRKKVWWGVYAADCWSAICHGNPPHIGLDTFDTLPPDMDDVRFDEDLPVDLQQMVEPNDANFHVSTGAGFLEIIKIARTTREIQHCSCQINPMMTRMQAHSQLAMVHERIKGWQGVIPECLTASQPLDAPGGTRNKYPLALSYYAAQVLLFRGLMSPATMAAKANPDSYLRKWFHTALAEFESFTTFITSVTLEDLTTFWGRHSRSQLILCGNFLIYLFLLASDPWDIELAYRMLETCQQALHRLSATEHVNGKTILRPTTIRIDSFFTQAAQVIRQGSNRTNNPPNIPQQ